MTVETETCPVCWCEFSYIEGLWDYECCEDCLRRVEWDDYDY